MSETEKSKWLAAFKAECAALLESYSEDMIEDEELYERWYMKDISAQESARIFIDQFALSK